MGMMDAFNAGYKNEPLSGEQRRDVGSLDYAAGMAGVLGRYGMEGVNAALDLGDMLKKSFYKDYGQVIYNDGGVPVAVRGGEAPPTIQDVTQNVMEVGVLSSPFGMMENSLLPDTSTVLGSFGGKLGKMVDNHIPHTDQQRTKNFEKWHGGDILLDDEKNPLLVGHGTPNSGFSSFDKKKAGSNTNAKDAEAVSGWFSDSLEGISSDYAYGMMGPNRYENIMQNGRFHGGESPGVIPGYAKAKNPYVYDAGGEVYSEKLFQELVSRMKSGGHDALVVKNVDDSLYSGTKGTVIGLSKPNQFKSKFNRGTFDDSDDFMLSTIPFVPPTSEKDK